MLLFHRKIVPNRQRFLYMISWAHLESSGLRILEFSIEYLSFLNWEKHSATSCNVFWNKERLTTSGLDLEDANNSGFYYSNFASAKWKVCPSLFNISWLLKYLESVMPHASGLTINYNCLIVYASVFLFCHTSPIIIRIWFRKAKNNKQ